jgi:hypothetical protein
MNDALVQVNLDTPRHKRSSRKLRPLFRVVSMVMPDDDSPRRGVGNITENVCTKALDADEWVFLRRWEESTYLGRLNHNEIVHPREASLHTTSEPCRELKMRVN